MQIEVVKNAKRNMVFGVMNKIIAIVCPFIARTVIQMVLGSQFLGLNSLFSSILRVLNLSELGIGGAIIYSMYKPVAENDIETVNALLNFYRKVYAVIGVVILGVGICLIPLLPHLISGTYPEGINLAIPYMLYLANTVISYFLFAYRSSLIVVYQRDDINSRTNAIVTVLLYAAQIIILLRTQNYYLYLLMMPIFTVVNNLRIAFVVHRMFPQYHCEGKITKLQRDDIRQRVGGAVISRVCQTLRNSLDSICLSAFVGLTLTAIYGNYYYIMSAIIMLMEVVTTSLQGGVGNHVATRSVDDNYKELREMDFAYMWLATWCTVCLLCLYQPFMHIWMGEDMMFPFSVVILFCLYFYMLKIGDMKGIYTTTNGLWWHHRYRSLMEAIGNLVLNILLGRFFGVYGIIIATMITLFLCNILWGSRITFRLYFGKDKVENYFRYQFKYLLTMVALSIITYLCCLALPIENVVAVLIVRLAFCIVIPNLIWILLYHKTSEFKYVMSIIKGIGSGQRKS